MSGSDVGGAMWGWLGLSVLVLSMGAASALRAQQPAASAAARDSVPVSALSACAAIDGSNERLACYDRLAGRGSARAGVSPGVRAGGDVGAGAGAGASGSSDAAGARANERPAALGSSRRGAPSDPNSADASSAAARQDAFGLYSAEHPTAPKGDPTLTRKVVAVTPGPNRHDLVELEGGQVWELLDDGDPVLASGRSVTIKRASLGSFLMTTSSGRTHRVHRIK